MNCSVGLCVYNNEFGLPFIFKNLLKLEQLFSFLQIIIYYDTSTDLSLQIIKESENLFKTKFIITEILHDATQYKTYNISKARNWIVSNISTEYFIMMDSNEYACIGDIQLSIIEEVLHRNSEWDAVSFDRDAGYYDTWALSFDPFIYSFFHLTNWQKVVLQMRESFSLLLENSKKNNPNEFIQVYSAFNGFAIYKTSIFIDSEYSNTIKIELFPSQILAKQIELTGEQIINKIIDDCEHRVFHLNAIKKHNARICIYPKSVFAKFTGTPCSISRGLS